MPAEHPAVGAFLEFFDCADGASKATFARHAVLEVVPQPVRYDVDIVHEIGGMLDNRRNYRIIQQSNEHSSAVHCPRHPVISSKEMALRDAPLPRFAVRCCRIPQ